MNDRQTEVYRTSAKPLIIGHRGASTFAPENTMAAFRLALEGDADGVEFDVHLSRDGVPVIIHDADLRRTGSMQVRVADLTVGELQEIDVGSWFGPGRSRKFATERIPTLEQLFELFESTDSLLYLEMKSESADRERLALACVEALRKSHLKHRVIVECFDLLGIACISSLDPTIKTAALFEPSLATPPRITSGKRLIDHALTVNADVIALHHRLATDRVVHSAKAEGFSVVVWTVDDPAWIARANSCGIDALITNDPANLVRHRDKTKAN
jgi:glycerophosphoryl diester phosphodiesterase